MANTLLSFTEKKCEQLLQCICNAKATHIFAAKILIVFENTLATTINEFVNNDSEQLGPDVFLNPGPAEP